MESPLDMQVIVVFSRHVQHTVRVKRKAVWLGRKEAATDRTVPESSHALPSPALCETHYTERPLQIDKWDEDSLLRTFN